MVVHGGGGGGGGNEYGGGGGSNYGHGGRAGGGRITEQVMEKFIQKTKYECGRDVKMNMAGK